MFKKNYQLFKRIYHRIYLLVTIKFNLKALNTIVIFQF